MRKRLSWIAAVGMLSLCSSPLEAQTIKPALERFNEVAVVEVTSTALQSILFSTPISILLGLLLLASLTTLFVREYQLALFLGIACGALMMLRYVSQYITTSLALVEWIIAPLLVITLATKMITSYYRGKQALALERAERRERRPSVRVRGGDDYGTALDEDRYSSSNKGATGHSSTSSASQVIKLNRPF